VSLVSQIKSTAVQQLLLIALPLLFAGYGYAQPAANVIAEFRFDEAAWNGTANEVIDSGPNGHFGKANNASTIKGFLCNAADLSLDSASDYLELDHRVLNGRSTLAISVWIKTPRKNGQALLSAARSHAGNNEFLLWFVQPHVLQPLYSSRSQGYLSTNNALDNTWHHLFFSRDSSQNCLYVDGELSQCRRSNPVRPLSVAVGGLILGQEQDAVGGGFSISQEWEGLIDELIFFERIPSASEIRGIYQQQLNGNNWDGSPRICLDAPELPEPLVHYAMEQERWNGNSGEVIDNVSGINGTATGGAQTQGSQPALPGNRGTCRYAEFDGVNDAVLLGNPAELNFTDAITLSAWIRPDAGRGINNIIAHGYHLTPRGEVFLRLRNGVYDVGSWNGRGYAVSARAPAGDIGSGNWVHLTGTYDGLYWRLYRNGSLLARARRGRGAVTVNSIWAIGARGTGPSRLFNGGIDEVRIYNHALTPAQVAHLAQLRAPCTELDHYTISHAGTYATCEAATIEVSGHNSLHNLQATNGSTITLSTSSGQGDWALKTGAGAFNNGAANDGIAEYTFAASEQRVEFFLQHRNANPAVNINITDGITTELSGDANEDASINFAQAALRFYANQDADNIQTQIAAKPFDAAPNSQTITLRAVQTNTDTGACESALVGRQRVEFAYECVNPSACISGQQFRINRNNIAANNQGTINAFTELNVDFDANGIASLSEPRYSDAGLVKLHARVDIIDSATGTTQTINGASNTFVSKPAGICVQATQISSSCSRQDMRCTVATTAGSPFELEVSARGWEKENDLDYCRAQHSRGAITPNYRASRIALNANLLSPTDALATNGVLGITELAITSGGINPLNNQTYSEVGVIEIEALPEDYFDQVVNGATSPPIGRFTPAYFKVLPLGLTNRADLNNCTSPFNYLDEPLTLNFSLEAYNANNELTENYHQGNGRFENYASLTTFDQLNIAALNGITNLSNRIVNENTATFNWNLTPGETLVSANISISRAHNSAIDGPFLNTRIGIAPADKDTVTLDPNDFNIDTDNNNNDDHFDIGGSDFYFGRLRIENAFGPQQRNLSVPVIAEYYNGQQFVQNTQDNCTQITTPKLIADTDPATHNLPLEKTQINNVLSPLISGRGEIELGGTPSINDFGSIDITLDAEPWLKFNWDNHLADDENPTGKATFGIYRGHDRIIYRHEVLQ
jgi:MSHA biogenesis protein MshQ